MCLPVISDVLPGTSPTGYPEELCTPNKLTLTINARETPTTARSLFPFDIYRMDRAISAKYENSFYPLRLLGPAVHSFF